MARRGSFGRQPRSAPSLASTLIAIAREMAAARDRNIMDAWQKGGTFEGKKVTDDMVLKHWKGRLEGIDKSDPLYDTYKNAYTQYEYAIAESKASTSYAQGKLTDTQMARFYLDWAKKVPKDSEFYRVLQRDGAQFMRSAAAKARAGGRGRRASAKQAAEDNYQAAQEQDWKKNEANGEYLLDTLRALAQRGSADAGIIAPIGGPGAVSPTTGARSDLTDFDSSDPEQMLKLLGLITPSPTTGRPGEPNTAILMHDEFGKPITGADIVAKVKSFDPKFNGQLTLNYIKDTIATQMRSLRVRVERAEATGHSRDANSLKEARAYVATLGRQVSAWPVEEEYMNLRADYQAVIANPASMPQDIVDAWRVYQSELTNLVDDPRIATDDNFRSRIASEANQQEGSPTLAESFTGATNGSPEDSDDIRNNRYQLDTLQTSIELVADPQSGYAWTTGVYDNAGNFTPKPGGPSVGAASVTDIESVSPVRPKIIYVPSPSGRTTPVLVTGVDITASATKPDGSKVKAPNVPVASAYIVNMGGVETTVYGFQTSDGTTMFSAETPWDEDKVRTVRNNSGISLDVSGMVPSDDAVAGTAGFTQVLEGRKGKERKVWVMNDPVATVLTSDETHNAAGVDPTTDFYSPTLAALMSSKEGRSTLGKLQQDKGFMSQMDYEARVAAKQSLQPDGTWSGGSAGAYANYSSQNYLAGNSDKVAEGVIGFINGAVKLWNRDTTEKTFSGSYSPSMPASGDGGGPSYPVTGLPTDKLKGTAMDALGSVFKGGTNRINAYVGKDKDDMAIRLRGEITVPAVVPALRPGPTPSPTPTPVPVPVDTKVEPTEPTDIRAYGPTPGARPTPTAGPSYPVYGYQQPRRIVRPPGRGNLI